MPRQALLSTLSTALVGRVLSLDPQTETIVGDEQALALLTKQYRSLPETA